MTTEINIVVATVEDALLVPADAVKDGRLFVVDDGRARDRRVQTGIVSPAMVQVVAGLRMDEQVILAPPAGLQDGQRVRGRPAS
jgi:multidrug efflux pump subunit AcrA (membrane-fusion protein)